MAKRDLPLFIFDLSRKHGIGQETDFITCTDIQSGFIAKIEILDEHELTGIEVDNITIRAEINQYSKTASLFTVLRVTGNNPSTSSQRSLLKKAAEEYKRYTQKRIDLDNLTNSDYINFVDILLRQTEEAIAGCGSDVNARQNYMYSHTILSSLIQKLHDED